MRKMARGEGVGGRRDNGERSKRVEIDRDG